MYYLPENQLRLGWLRIPEWHAAGYLGDGLKILVVDADTDLSYVRYPEKVTAFKNSGNASYRINSGYHALMTIDVLQQIVPNAEILFVAWNYTLTDAIRWGISNKADIATVSLAYNYRSISAYESQQALDSGMLLLTSAGNEGDLPEDLKGYPAKKKSWIAVGAAFVHYDGTIERPAYSATGPSLEVMGMSHLYVDFPELEVPYVYTGTSCASPALAGCLALHRQKEGPMTQTEMRHFFETECIDMFEPGRDDKSGWGMFRLPSVETSYKVIKLQIGNDKATIDGEEVTIDQPPFIVPETSRTVVPLRFISEALDCTVLWIPKTKEIVIKQAR